MIIDRRLFVAASLLSMANAPLSRSQENSVINCANDIGGALRDARRRLPAKSVINLTSKTYNVDDELAFDVAGVTLLGNGAVIRFNGASRSCFRVTAPSVTIADISITNDANRTRLTGSFEDSPARDRNSGIYVKGVGNATIQDVTIRNFNDGVYLRGNIEGVKARGNRVLRLTTSGCDMGLLFAGQDNLLIEDVSSSSITDVQDNPPHAVYGSRLGGGNGHVVARRLRCSGNGFDSGFKFKACDLDVDGLAADNCQILAQFEQCSGAAKNMILDHQIRTTANSPNAVFLLESPGLAISALKISAAAGYAAMAVRIEESPGAVLRNITINVARSSRDGPAPIQIKNSDNAQVHGLTYRDAGRSDEEVFRIIDSSNVSIDGADLGAADHAGIMVGSSSNCTIRSTGSARARQNYWRTTGTGKGNASL